MVVLNAKTQSAHQTIKFLNLQQQNGDGREVEHGQTASIPDCNKSTNSK